MRILLALEQPLLSLGVRSVLVSDSGFEVVGEVNSPGDVKPAVEGQRPGMLLLDARFTALDKDMLPALAREYPDCRVVVMVDHTDEECTVRRLLANPGGFRLSSDALEKLKECCLVAFRSSARGCIAKSAPPERLLEAVRTVAAGGYYAGPGLTAHWVESVRRGLSAEERRAVLTPREIEVVALVVEGLANKEIAGKLGLSEQTVKNHLRRILDKLGLESRVELALYAVRTRLA
ncbi:MAG: LuxR C-terminal-related transcriptional regulator [Armatimonadota bacterium]